MNEAQAYKMSFVRSNNGDIPEAVGFEEYVVEDGNDFEEQMAEKVVEILKNDCDSETLINRAANFTWDKIVEKEIATHKEAVRYDCEKMRFN